MSEPVDPDLRDDRPSHNSDSGYLQAPVAQLHTVAQVATDDCTRRGCGRPLSEHDWGIFCP